MCKFKGTPGPWEIRDAGICFEISNKKECCVVAKTNGWDPQYKNEESWNAQLIAAAPELLEALQNIAEYWNQDTNDTAMFDACLHAINTANEAIAKALGENEK